MNTFLTTSLAGIISCAVALPTVAGNGAPSGPHYNLNIIGVTNPKKADMTGSNRHTIFVPLKSTKSGFYSKSGWDPDGNVLSGTAIVDSKIWLTPGPDFKVCDGNGFDAAYGCDGSFDDEWNYSMYDENGNLIAGELVSTKQGAVFQLPCNTNLDGNYAYIDIDGDGDDEQVELDYLVSCNEAVTVDGMSVPLSDTDVPVPTANYQVWARALGQPGGKATVTTCATVHGELQCSLENEVMTRSKGKSTFTDVTNELTSLVVSYCDGEILEDGSCDGKVTYTRIALFAGNTEDWFWNYDNKGLRLAQLRFYHVD